MQKIESVTAAVKLLVGNQTEVNAMMMKQGERYQLVLRYMEAEAVSLQDIHSTFQTCEGSDWQQELRQDKETGKVVKVYLAQNIAIKGREELPAVKANKKEGIKAIPLQPAVGPSIHAQAYARFRTSVTKAWEFTEKNEDGDTFPIIEDGELVPKEKSDRAPQQSKGKDKDDKTGEAKILEYSDAAFKMMIDGALEKLSIERADNEKLSRKARVARNNAIAAKIELLNEVVTEFELAI